MRQQYDRTKLFCIALIVLGALFVSDFVRMLEFGRAGTQEGGAVSQAGIRVEGAVPEAASQEGEAAPQGDPTVAVYVEGRTPGVWAAAGSGVILDVGEDALWIVTAGHVLERAGEECPVKVKFGEGSTAECTRYELAADADLAFLCIFKEALPEGCRERTAAKTDKAGYDGLAGGDIVQTMGYRDGEPVIFSGTVSEPWIYVEDFEQYMLVAACEMDYGMSGGGLYDERGMLIGIVCGANEQGELAAVPLHVVQARFAELRLQD